jgi:guanylate kinase
MIENNDLLENNCFNNNYYGTSKSEIERISKEGKVCILEMDVNGANQTFKLNYPANYIGILPPSIDILEKRLIGRDLDSKEVIEKRILIGKKEVEQIYSSDIFNKKIVNDDILNSYMEFKNTLSSMYPNLEI